jgi:Uma2 family endonuclease
MRPLPNELRFSRADYQRLPEGFPAQLFDGWLVKEPAPSWQHQSLVGRLHLLFVRHADPELVLFSPVDVGLDDWNVVQPDLVVLRRLPPGVSSDVGIPRVAVEVLSPSTRRRDRVVKAGKLLDAGVEEIWLVDRERGEIEIRTPTSTRVFEGEDLAASLVIPDLATTPADLFRRLR